jgi:hypothetical protein
VLADVVRRSARIKDPAQFIDAAVATRDGQSSTSIGSVGSTNLANTQPGDLIVLFFHIPNAAIIPTLNTAGFTALGSITPAAGNVNVNRVWVWAGLLDPVPASISLSHSTTDSCLIALSYRGAGTPTWRNGVASGAPGTSINALAVTTDEPNTLVLDCCGFRQTSVPTPPAEVTTRLSSGPVSGVTAGTVAGDLLAVAPGLVPARTYTLPSNSSTALPTVTIPPA